MKDNRLRKAFEKGMNDRRNPFWPLSCPFHVAAHVVAWERGVDQAWAEMNEERRLAQEKKEN